MTTRSASPQRLALAARAAAAYQANPAKSVRALARELGVSHPTIWRMIKANPAKIAMRKIGGQAKLTPEMDQQIRTAHRSLTLDRLAQVFGVSKATVCRSLRRTRQGPQSDADLDHR